jgi:hypothetical protein
VDENEVGRYCGGSGESSLGLLFNSLGLGEKSLILLLGLDESLFEEVGVCCIMVSYYAPRDII